MNRLASRERFSFGQLREVLALPDLIAVQRESFQWFVDTGIAEVLRDISPIEDFTGQLKLELSDHVFDPPKHSEDECRERDMTFARPLFVTARFMNAGTGEIKEQTVFMGDFPMMTARGTFIINGTERIVVSQLVRSPGVYFDVTPDKTSPEKDIVSAKMIPGRGAWLEFDIDKRTSVGIAGDLSKYMQFNAAEGLAQPGSTMGATMGAAMGAGMGFNMGANAGPWGAAPAAAAPPPPPAPPAAKTWHIAENGATKGPFTETELTAMAQSGALTRASQVWTAGQDGWKPASDTGLSQLFAMVPPPPPAQ